MRYFFSTDSYNKVSNVYRFDTKQDIQDAWNVTDWNRTRKVSDWLAMGEGWLDEVDEETARKHFPQAFE